MTAKGILSKENIVHVVWTGLLSLPNPFTKKDNLHWLCTFMWSSEYLNCINIFYWNFTFYTFILFLNFLSAQFFCCFYKLYIFNWLTPLPHQACLPVDSQFLLWLGFALSDQYSNSNRVSGTVSGSTWSCDNIGLIFSFWKRKRLHVKEVISMLKGNIFGKTTCLRRVLLDGIFVTEQTSWCKRTKRLWWHTFGQTLE